MVENKILDALNGGESVAVHHKDVEEYLDLETCHEKIYLRNINPAKEVAAEILSELSTASRNTIYKKYTTNEIVKEIKKKAKNGDVLIVFNDLQQMSNSTVRIFLDILENLQIFCSIRGGTKNHHKRLLKKLVVIRDPEDEMVDITLAVIALISILAAIAYFKISMTFTGHQAYVILGSLWFALLIGRTMLWIKD
ncbi:hypothetical protein [Methanothermobacter sp.]|uniref:hypothetical protein n=1 Tax=Methanothermobacter sp. TaxID=1884223 RepID=UPI002610FF34|nr:hypothetical protein [Methanothermobacter sp.]MDI9615133.1 hypothetical protein [Methanothermobacter sp.]